MYNNFIGMRAVKNYTNILTTYNGGIFVMAKRSKKLSLLIPADLIHLSSFRGSRKTTTTAK